jgi:hypothetical protein
VAGGADAAAALEEVLGEKLPAIEEGWRKHVEGLK